MRTVGEKISLKSTPFFWQALDDKANLELVNHPIGVALDHEHPPRRESASADQDDLLDEGAELAVPLNAGRAGLAPLSSVRGSHSSQLVCR
jgi:hypothetical protein